MNFITFVLVFFLDESVLKEFFAERKDSWISYLKAEMKSPLITTQIKKIPKNKIEFGKTPTVHLEFTADKGVKILVTHVDPYYQSYLSIYESTLTQSGYPVILGQFPTWEKFSKQYQIIEQNKTSIRVQIKGGLPEDYALFFLQKDHQIHKAKYFENQKEVAELSYEYKKYSDKNRSILLPSKLHIHIFHPKSEAKKFFVELIPLQVTFSHP